MIDIKNKAELKKSNLLWQVEDNRGHFKMKVGILNTDNTNTIDSF